MFWRILLSFAVAVIAAYMVFHASVQIGLVEIPAFVGAICVFCIVLLVGANTRAWGN